MDRYRIRLLRMSRDMSLDDLAAAMGRVVSKQMLSRYERGLSKPSVGVVAAMASALGVPPSRLTEPLRILIQPLGYRKRVALRKTDAERIESLLQSGLERRVRLQQANRTDAPKIPILKYKISVPTGAEQAAEALRREWSLGDDPIACLVDELESRLLHVIEVDAPTNFDGLSVKAYDEGKLVAVAAAIRSGLPGDRQRLTLAHELGHIVLDVAPGVDEEKVAYRFAAAFLAPANAILRDVGAHRSSLDLIELAALKQRYGVSLQAVVYRLRDLGVISERLARDWFVRIRASGWAKVEPWQVQREEPRWLKMNVRRALAEGVLRLDEARELLGDGGTDSAEDRSELLEMMAMSLEERRRLLEESVEQSVTDYEVDAEWVESRLEEPAG